MQNLIENLKKRGFNVILVDNKKRSFKNFKRFYKRS